MRIRFNPRLLLAAASAALTLVAVGCRKIEPWEGSFASLEALGEAAAQALSDGDAEALRKLRVNKEEYLGWIWNEFPASKPPPEFSRRLRMEQLKQKQLSRRTALDGTVPRKKLEICQHAF